MQLCGLRFATDHIFMRRNSFWEQVQVSDKIDISNPEFFVVYLSRSENVPTLDAELRRLGMRTEVHEDDEVVFASPLEEAYLPANLVRLGQVISHIGLVLSTENQPLKDLESEVD